MVAFEKYVDNGWHAGYYDKFYIPIQNADGAVFAFDDGVIAPKEGDVYWFDNSVPQWVENNSEGQDQYDRLYPALLRGRCVSLPDTVLDFDGLYDSEWLTFDMYFSSVCTMRYHPGIRNKRS